MFYSRPEDLLQAAGIKARRSASILKRQKESKYKARYALKEDRSPSVII